MNMKHYTAIAVLLAATTDHAMAQHLRRAVAAADLVVIATAVRMIPTKTHVIHRLRIDEVLRGPVGFDKSTKVSIAITKRVSIHNKPTPAKPMLYFLHDYSRPAAEMNLPRGYRPYYKMSGYAGSAVVLRSPRSADPRLAYARILVASQKGQASRKTAEQLFRIALTGDVTVRTEATQSLGERPALMTCLTDMHLSKLLTRAAGETTDIKYKIALAEICAIRKLPALLPTLALGAEHVEDPAFLRALGRFARFIHGDEAHNAIIREVRRASGKTRERLIFSLGATATEGALKTLMAMQKGGENPAAVEAALRIHGSPKATEAIARKKATAKKKQSNEGRKNPRQP